MKTTNIGLILLTVLVVTKYVITLDTYTSQEGSFKSGLTIDYTVMSEFIAKNSESSKPILLATYSPTPVESHSIATTVSRNNVTQTNDQSEEPSNHTSVTPGYHANSEEVIPMEHGNSLVVFDPASPAITEMKTQYVDQYDNAAPLDNGNTVVNEMLMMMPRR